MPEIGIPVTLETPRGTLTFNNFTSANHLRLTDFKLNAGVRSAVEAIPRRDGSIVPDAFRNGATPILEGEIKTADLTWRADMQDEIRAHGVSLLRADGILRWTPTGKSTRRLVVRCLEDPQDGGRFIKTFQLALVSRTAYSESDTLNVVDLSSLDSSVGGGLEFPFEFPFSFGAGLAAGSAFITNNGDTEAWPKVRLTGPLTNPTIRNATTDQDVALVTTINAGEFIEIDMAAESVLLNGSPSLNKIGTIDPTAAQFWSLAEGTNEIRLTATSHGAGHGAAVYWRDAFA